MKTGILQKLSSMDSNFRRPTVQDSLFQADYLHQEPASDGVCTECDLEYREQRLERTTNDPDIHFGLIGSGNLIIRDATKRELLREKHGVLCAEMEAAGVMTDFPCLVVRGISDYCDSHKNKVWQDYAAATSAACARELLNIIDTGEIDSTPRALGNGE